MNIQEIHKKAGYLPGYLGYFFLLFLWYFFTNIIDANSSGNKLLPLLSLLLSLVVGSFLYAGLYGGIHAHQRDQEISTLSGFVTGVKSNYGRFVGANLLYDVFTILLSILIVTLASAEQTGANIDRWINLIQIPISAIYMFWMAAIAVEHKVFPSFARAVKTILTNPFALAIGIAWGLVRFADLTVLDLPIDQTSLALNGWRSGPVALARVLLTVYALAVYKAARGDELKLAPEETPVPADPSSASAERWAKASFGFAFVAFLPLVHLVALVLGIIALRRKGSFGMRPAIACAVGGFFTAYYFLVLVGLLAVSGRPAGAPGFGFLEEANAGAQSYVAQLEQADYQTIPQQIAQTHTLKSDWHWTELAASALAKYYDSNLDSALADFRIAAGRKPERSEFYYYYGVALLSNQQADQAAEQFKMALSLDPQLAAAGWYLDLIENTYSPSWVVSSIMFVIILLFLFTFHEYAHAYFAWKSGDDTAKEQGRLTLNPLPHLDLFGSILLPGIMLLQQSSTVFGWAKPVPVNPENFKDPVKDHVRVSFAGPAMNLLIAMLSFLVLGGLMLFMRLIWPETISLNFATPFAPVSLAGPPAARWIAVGVVFLKQLMFTSFLLGVFNLIPIPPLDGSWIFAGILPQGLRNLLEKTRRYSFVFFLLLVLNHAVDYILEIPIAVAWGGVELLASLMGFGSY